MKALPIVALALVLVAFLYFRVGSTTNIVVVAPTATATATATTALATVEPTANPEDAYEALVRRVSLTAHLSECSITALRDFFGSWSEAWSALSGGHFPTDTVSRYAVAKGC